MDHVREQELARGLIKNTFIRNEIDVSDDDDEEIHITPNAVYKVGAVEDDDKSEGVSEPDNVGDSDDSNAENIVEDDDEEDLEIVETGNVGNVGNNEVGDEDVVGISAEKSSGSEGLRGEPEKKKALDPIQNPVRISLSGNQDHDSGKSHWIVNYFAFAFLIC